MRLHILCEISDVGFGGSINAIFGIFPTVESAREAINKINYFGEFPGTRTVFTKYPNSFGEDTFIVLINKDGEVIGKLMILTFELNEITD